MIFASPRKIPLRRADGRLISGSSPEARADTKRPVCAAAGGDDFFVGTGAGRGTGLRWYLLDLSACLP